MKTFLKIITNGYRLMGLTFTIGVFSYMMYLSYYIGNISISYYLVCVCITLFIGYITILILPNILILSERGK